MEMCMFGPSKFKPSINSAIHRGPTIKDILSKLAKVKLVALMHASSDYHDLECDEKLSYLTTFAC